MISNMGLLVFPSSRASSRIFTIRTIRRKTSDAFFMISDTRRDKPGDASLSRSQRTRICLDIVLDKLINLDLETVVKVDDGIVST